MIKVKIIIDKKSVILTESHLREIDSQRKIFTIDNIDTVKDAEIVLKNCKNHVQCIESEFIRIKDWINYQIETIAKAINYLDNDKVEWEIDFNDKKQQKHYPYFEKINNGLVFHDSFFSYYYFVGQVAFFKKQEHSNMFGKKFVHLYEQLSNF